MLWKEITLFLMGKRKISTTISKPVSIYALRILNRKSYLYVGQTKQTIEARVYNHLLEAMNGKHKNIKLQNAIRKYRFLITFDILEICSEKDADKKEKFWIDKLLKEKHPLTNIRNPMNRFSNLKEKK